MENLSYLLMQTTRQLKNSLDKRLGEYNITASQFSVLYQISSKNGSITSAEIADVLGLDRPTISGIISRLEGKGMLQRLMNPLDKRSVYLKLTDEAMQLTANLKDISDQLSLDIFSEMDEVEKRQLEKCLLKIIEGAKLA